MLSFLFSLFLQVQSKVILSINCGGEDYIDSTGTHWSQDTYFDGGSPQVFNENRYIRFTSDPYLYMSERQHQSSFFYSIPQLIPGKYVLILKNSEIFNSKGKRMTYFFIGSQKIDGFIDLFNGIKDSAAMDEFIYFEVSSEGLLFNGTVIQDAFRDGKLILKFLKAAGDVARVAGIQVITGGLKDAGFEEYSEQVLRFKRLLANKNELSEKSLNFPKDHIVLTSVNMYSVMLKFPFTIIFLAIVFYLALSKVISS
jgi:hypothetical protein